MTLWNNAVRRGVGALVVGSVLLSACAPAAAPAPTPAPAKPAEAAKPAAQATPAAAKPAASPAAKPAAAASPATKPATAASPAASPAAAKPADAAKPGAAPATKIDTQAAASFYNGKTIRLITGGSPGGGYDTYSRIIAKHMGEHIPGNPNIVVENMPGAGFLIAANYLANQAPKDGTVVGNFGVGVVLQDVLGNEGVNFDASAFEFLGVPAADTSLCVATRESGLTSLAQTMGPNGEEFIVGATGLGNPLLDQPLVLREALDANFKIVPGFGGTADVRLAMERGEVEGMCGWSWESLKIGSLDKIESGEWRVISQQSSRPHPELPNVPVALDLAKTDEAKQLIRYGIILPSERQRQYVAPPGTPDERVAVLRQAFMETMKDTDFLTDIDKANLAVDPISGEEDEELIRELRAMPQSIQERLKQIWK